jgi:hypothetical protein
MIERPYDSEADLQALIEKYPALLSGDDSDDSTDRRWLLIKREAGVPSEEQGADRWSADHFLVDHEGIPTIVEVKRSTDTRARREVVAQMLDYAANAVSYWGVGKIQGWFEGLCLLEGLAASEHLSDSLGWEDYDGFWKTVEENLHTGRVRMIWVADVIPNELRRIVEFLNEQMSPAEALAVEMRQFLGDEGTIVLAPRQLGSTVALKARKRTGSSSGARHLTHEEIASAIEESAGVDAAAFTRRLKQWTDERGAKSWCAREWIVFVDAGKDWYFPLFYVLVTGHIRFRLGAIRRGGGPMASEDMRDQLLERLNLLGVSAESTIHSAPKLAITDLIENGLEQRFLELTAWMLDLAQASQCDDESRGDTSAS